jgi:RHH-type proline utilization regulon transcriptional repressor/proline dehydrogenase/delta 1-pyrroline-5-carboxylate dehydrogenase
MRILAQPFVMGRSIAEALERASRDEVSSSRYSFDMLGEAARTAAHAQRHFDAYGEAIAAVGKVAAGRGPIAGPGVSIKLSALHPRYEPAQADRVRKDLTPRVLELAHLSRDAGIGLTLDAEEAERLDVSLDVLETVSADAALGEWDGLGLAVQA